MSPSSIFKFQSTMTLKLHQVLFAQSEDLDQVAVFKP